MENTFIIPVNLKDDLQKRLEKLAKKANVYGKYFVWQWGNETVVSRDIYTVCGNETAKSYTENVFGIEINISTDIIKKDGYTVIACIEHNPNGNIVTVFDDSIQANTEWYTMPAYCVHCHTKHAKRYTFIVMDSDGNYKQIGKSCLKDYCGIDPAAVVSAQDIHDLIVNDYDIDDYDFSESGDYAYNVCDIVATANDIIKEYGYVKSCENSSTKSRLFSQYGTFEPSAESKKIAHDMQEFFRTADYNDLTDYQKNVKSLFENGYCRSKMFGYLAYAPVAYQQIVKKQTANTDNTANSSDYVGNVGARITVSVKESRLITSWETAYGYTHLYSFITDNDNVLVWYASRYIEGTPVKITGTVKEHKDYNGVKQTVITRCKVM